MRLLTITLCLFVLTAAASPSVAQSTHPSTRPDPPDPAALLAALSRGDWRERERARDALIDGGDELIPQLRRFIAESGDAEARRGAQLALDRIEENTRLGPSKITLDFDDAPWPQVFEALGRQEGFLLQWSDPRLEDGPAFPNISVHLHSVSYWDAIKALEKKGGGISADLFPGEMWLSRCFLDARAVEPPTIIHGPFLVRVTDVDWNRHLGMDRPADISRVLSVSVEIQAEPKLRLLDTEVSATLKALDGAGKVLCQSEPDDGKPQSLPHFPADHRFFAALSPGPGVEPKSLTLSGKIRFRVLVKSSQFDVPDPLTTVKDAIGGQGGFTRQIGGVQATLAYFRRDESGSATLILSVSRDGRGDAPWEELCGVLSGSPVKLLAGDGSVVYQDWPSRSSREDHVEFQAFLPQFRDSKPAKLVWDIPTKYRDFEVPFEFKGLPVP